MGTAEDVVQEFQQLPALEQVKVAWAIQASRPLPDPPQPYVGVLWIMVVGAFIVLLLGGTVLVYLDGATTQVIAPLITGALGVLAGLLAPSPIRGGGGG